MTKNDTTFGPLAQTILRERYAQRPGETWPQVAHRVASNVLGAVHASPEMIREVEELIVSRKFIPGGRYLAMAGRQLAPINNCLGANTEIMTLAGIKRISDAIGPQTLLGDGRWVQGDVRSFGVQPVMSLTLRRGRLKRTIKATPNHRWFVVERSKHDRSYLGTHEVTTDALRPGDEVAAAECAPTQYDGMDKDGIIHGIFYGDGCGRNGCIRLCGPKSELAEHLSGYPVSSWHPDGDPIYYRLPSAFKQLPSLSASQRYLWGWLAGYLATDGCVDKEGKVLVAACDEAVVRFVRDVCCILGVRTYSLRYQDRISNLTGRPSRLHILVLSTDDIPDEIILREKHRQRIRKNECRKYPWRVVSAQALPEPEEVFCAVVPDGHAFALEGNILTGNCYLLRAEDSREGWADLLRCVALCLMFGGGVGVDYSAIRADGKPIRRTGGVATGPLALMQMVNEVGRGIRSGGNRRSALFGSLSWSHADVQRFIRIKDWSPEIRALKEANFSHPAVLDGTNISVALDDSFFRAVGNENHAKHTMARQVYMETVHQMCKKSEPGFQVDVGVNKGETLRNACVPGHTEILTEDGYQRIDSLVGSPVNVWNGFEFSTVTPRQTGENVPLLRVELSDGSTLECTPNHEWAVVRTPTQGTQPNLFVRVKASHLMVGDTLKRFRFPVVSGGLDVAFAYAQGFLAAEGMDGYDYTTVYAPKAMCLDRLRPHCRHISTPNSRGTCNAFFAFAPYPKRFCPFDWSVQSRLDWFAGLVDGDGTSCHGSLQLGSVDRDFLVATKKLLTTLGVASKVTGMRIATQALMPDGNGGKKLYDRRPFYRLLVPSAAVHHLVSLGMRCERVSLERQTQRDTTHYVTVAAIEDAGVADKVYCFNEPLRHLGCFEGTVTGQCTEVTSETSGDVCDLGSINLSRIESIEEMRHAVDLATAFLLAGTVYSAVPYPEVDHVRTKNRRLGLGLMGIHEWLLRHGKRYGPDDDLAKLLEVYATSTEVAAKWADEWELSHPVKTRAIAPVGTISLIAETTSGIEPLFCVAYKRRYLHGNTWKYQYVVDPTAQRLIADGAAPDSIEDAYSLASDVERRVAFQAWLQQYVDHAISSTINLPAWGTPQNNEDTTRAFGEMLLPYLPKLRGLTVYADGSRGGQPITTVSYATAMKHVGEVFTEQGDVCSLSRGGVCGE